MTLFTCKLCGKTYEALPAPVPEHRLPEEVEQLRQAWLTAESKWSLAPDNEHYERAMSKAWFAYMATKSAGVERVPDELVTQKGKDGFYLACAEPCGVAPSHGESLPRRS